MFMPKGTLTNQRVVSTEPLVNTTPTKGSIQISPSAQKILGLEPGDRTVIIVGSDAEGNDTYGIAKGHDNPVTGKNYGQKVGYAGGASAKGGSMIFSSANTWDTLGGNSETKQVFKIDSENAVTVVLDERDNFVMEDDAPLLVEEGTSVEEVDNEAAAYVVTIYPLEFVREEDKLERSSSEEEEVEEEA